MLNILTYVGLVFQQLIHCFNLLHIYMKIIVHALIYVTEEFSKVVVSC